MYDDTLIRKRGRRPKEAYVSIPISPTAANERIRRQNETLDLMM